MTEAKFTKGDWEIDDTRVILCDGHKIAYVCSGCGIPLTELVKANASLISTAPEMYKALIQVQQEGGLSVARHKSISRLLAKARGIK